MALAYLASWFSGKSSEPRPSKLDSLGFKELYCGSNPEVDIVAVHGLNGHRIDSWTHQPSGVMWLKDLLPAKVENARILTYGYDAETHGLDLPTNQTMSQHGDLLAEKLAQERVGPSAQRRPIIFIAHSLGGLIVKHALLYCNSATPTHLPYLRVIKISTYAVLYFGTPHNGANGVTLQKWLINVLSIYMHTNKKVINNLDRDSEHLMDLTKRFLPISGDFKTIFFYETYPTHIFAGKDIVIAPYHSAVVPTQGVQDAAINRDHVKMVKFHSDEDNEFIGVSRHIQGFVKEAPVKIRENWDKEDRWSRQS